MVAISTSQSTGQLNALTEMGLYLVRAMDASKRQIVSVSSASSVMNSTDIDKENSATVTFKDGTSAPVKISVLLSQKSFCNGTLIVANTKENVLALVEAWQQALNFPKMTLIFLDSRSGNKWLLRPTIHVKIAEPKNLAQGLISLYEQSLVK